MIDKRTNEKVLMKTYRYKLSAKYKSLFYQEVKTLATMQHRAIIKFYGWYIVSPKRCHIYLKYAEKGSLYDVLQMVQRQNPDPLWDETHKLIISYGVANAMKYLHSNSILHRHLTLDNVLIDENLYPYVTDFGKYKDFDSISGKVPFPIQFFPFIPPEIISDVQLFWNSMLIDVYSYGMLLYCIWTEQEDIFSRFSSYQLIEKLLKGQRPEFPSDFPYANWRKLIEACWHQDPRERPTFESICELLETPNFLTENVDKEEFESYKEILSKDAIEPILNCFDQMKKEAENGDQEAQLLYALHLYNGFNFEKNVDESIRYFQLSADKGNPESQFYYSLVLAQKGDAEKSAEYYQKSLDSGCAEALSFYAKQLIETGQIDDSLQYLYVGLIKGSMSAMISYGNLCASDDKFGCSSIFYDMASSCCHCLDCAGSFLPVEYRVFRCEDCGIEVCEGCAKSCHEGHSVVDIGSKSCFFCGCGVNHFAKKGENVNRCSTDFVGEMKYEDKPALYQHFFKCLDCSYYPGSYSSGLICKGCAELCHKQHRVVDCGVRKGFCSCGSFMAGKGTNCKASHFINAERNECSSNDVEGPALQRWFQCLSCGLYGSDEQGVCFSCAKKCHRGHALLDRGVKKRCCMCNITGTCQLKKQINISSRIAFF